MKKFKNFTPHPVVVFDSEGKNVILTVPVSGSVRVSENLTESEPINGIPTVLKTYGDCIGLPEKSAETILICSVIVLQALSGSRDDVVCPDTGIDSVVRDESGRILGVRRFQR